jgi:DNA-nicking Smr family endonuclease
VSKKRRDLTADEKKLWRRVAASVKTRRRCQLMTKSMLSRRRISEPLPLRRQRLPLLSRRARNMRRRRKIVATRSASVAASWRSTASSICMATHKSTGRAALARFLRNAQARGDRTVIVITGVGRGGEGVLKRRFPEWIAERDLRVFTSGYAPAHRAHGGAGAFYVFIKRGD